MRLYQLIFKENSCFKANRKIAPKGGMLHSTGANNLENRRYVNPDDGCLGLNLYNDHRDVPGRRSSCIPSSELTLSLVCSTAPRSVGL